MGGKGVVDRSSSKTASPAPFLVNGQCTSGSCTKTPFGRFREIIEILQVNFEIRIGLRSVHSSGQTSGEVD